MATVFMKWLETSPRDYDRGIAMLTLGRLEKLKKHIIRRYVRDGSRILEIGCGTGQLTQMMAEAGGMVTALDSSPAMLSEAENRILQSGLRDSVTLKHIDATMVGEHFSPQSFDLIVSTLVFSELSNEERSYVLEACHGLLTPKGCLVIADEVIPSTPLPRFIYTLVRAPLILFTWLLTRSTTKPLENFDSLLTQSGFQTRVPVSYLGDSLRLYEAQLKTDLDADSHPADGVIPTTMIRHLQHHTTLRTVLLDIWTLINRMIPPYPKVKTGLYSVGEPSPDSPVLVTGNYDLTVRRLVRAIDGSVDAWVLVADSGGINVWCAAGGGFFTADKVIAALKTSGLDQFVKHHALILPQLAANGVDGWRIRAETGWGVHWGPVRAEDIPAYLKNKREKTDSMRWVRYPLKDRLEMVTVGLAFYALLILLPILIFWRGLFWPLTVSLFGLSYFYAIVHPWLPGRDGLWKSIPLTAIALAGLYGYAFVWNPLPPHQLFNWTLGLTGLSVFTGGELQGMSPLMRGEQANWGWGIVIAITLGLVWWLLPLAIGWR
jgi:2-polyprenyl-3-methyl-5-hydroxy-6-metoxy-1,4-benzoquinol methylase